MKVVGLCPLDWGFWAISTRSKKKKSGTDTKSENNLMKSDAILTNFLSFAPEKCLPK